MTSWDHFKDKILKLMKSSSAYVLILLILQAEF